MDKKFAIFDMDGTLVDSMPYWHSLGREFLRSKGVTGDVEAVLQQIKPMTMLESSELFIREFGLEGSPESVSAEMNGMMDEHYRQDVQARPGVGAYLRRLREKGVTMCVASATAAPLVESCLTRLGLAEDFTFLLSCDEVGAGKNRPDVFLEAARRLGAEPGETAVFEDALFAAATAHEAGFYTVGIYDENGKHHWERLQAVADECIPDWETAAKQL